MQRPNNKPKNVMKPFTSSGVSAEYKAALAVFNDALLSEACNLLLRNRKEAGKSKESTTNANTENSGNGKDYVREKGAAVQKKYQAMYNKCKSAYATITKTESMPGFLKTLSQQSLSNKHKHQMPHRPTSMQSISMQHSFRRTSSVTNNSTARISSAPPGLKRSSSVTNNSSSRIPSAPTTLGSGRSSNMHPPPPHSHFHLRRGVSNANSMSPSLAASSLSSSSGGKNIAPPKSAVKFLEALNRQNSTGAGGTSLKTNNDASSARKRKNESLASRSAPKSAPLRNVRQRKSRIEDEKEQDTDDDEEEEFQDDEEDEEESSSSGSEEEEYEILESKSTEADDKIQNEENKGHRTRSTRSTERQNMNQDDRRQSPRRRRVSTDRTKEEEQKPPASVSTKKTVGTKSAKETVDTKAEKEIPPPASPKRKTRSSQKLYAPKKATGEVLNVGDEVLVYHSPHDKWYESIVSNVNYKEKAKAQNKSNDGGGTNSIGNRRSGRNRNKSVNYVGGAGGEQSLDIVSYDVEYDNGEHEENVIPLNIMKHVK